MPHPLPDFDALFNSSFLYPLLFLLVLEHILLASAQLLQEPGVHKAVVVGRADNEMIDHRDVQEQTDLVHPVSNVFVFQRRLQFTAGVVVDHDNLDGPLLERKAEYLGRIDSGVLRVPQADQLYEQDPVAVRQADDPEVLFAPADLVLSQQDLLHDQENIA